MNRRTKNTIILSLLLAIIAFGTTGYYLYNKGPRNVKNSKAQTVTATQLFGYYLADSTGANEKFTDKVVAVSGEIEGVSLNLEKQQVVLLKTQTAGSAINCTMEEPVQDIHLMKHISLKGICSGLGEGDPDLGIKGDVYVTRCYYIEQ